MFTAFRNFNNKNKNNNKNDSVSVRSEKYHKFIKLVLSDLYINLLIKKLLKIL